MAEGVRIYNQDTWKLVTHGQGKQLVEQYIAQMVNINNIVYIYPLVLLLAHWPTMER